MGLDSFDIAPDNTGGRPSGSNDSDGSNPERSETAHTLHKEGEEYWQEAWDIFVAGDEPEQHEMRQLCQYSKLLPHAVKQRLTEHGICEFSMEERRERDEPDMSTSSNSNTTDDELGSSGLSGLVNDAK